MTRTTRSLAMLLLSQLALTACAYEPPIIEIEDDYPESVSLSGELISSDGPASLGPGHILLYSTDNLPPPSGFGSPVSLGTVPAGAWDGAEGALKSAPWSLSNIASGSYIITGLIDNDVDFNPFYEFTGGATCGDQLGAYAGSLTTGAIAAVDVQAPEAIDGISVIARGPLGTERPAFEIGGYFLVDAAQPTEPPQPVDDLTRASLGPTIIQVINLNSVGIEHELLTINPPDAPICPSAFLVTLLDEDGDGVIDPHDNALAALYGMKKSFPKIYLRFMSDFEGNALPPEQGTYLTEAVVITLDWTDGPQWEAAGLEDPVPDALPNVPFLTDSLNLAFLPIAAHIYDDDGDPSTPEVTEYVENDAVPMGYWQVIAVLQTGQTWLVPNAMANPLLQAAYGWTDIPSQGMLVPIR